jgi:transposase
MLDSASTVNGYFALFFLSCSCPDYQTRHERCKRVWAASYVMMREQHADGSTTVTETVTVSRKTYAQNWPAYNAAQTEEKERFQSLLFELCAGIREPQQAAKRGRPTLPLSDAIFSAAFKVYSTVSGRRFMCDLRESHKRGFISKVPHYNSIFTYLEKPELTPLLRALITQSSLPLKAVETDFAVDSSGFTTSRFHRWFDHKYGKEPQEHDWVKCHLMCGVKTNVVTAVEIHDRNASDTKLLPPLLQATRENFMVREVSADKGYSSKKNAAMVEIAGGTPFISFTSQATGEGGRSWGRMYHFFQFRRDEFLAHYHKRSNVESTFSMMKRKFGDSLRSKTDTAMVNETLCKVLCHNLVVLIHEIHELGIDPVFWSESQEPASVA